MTSTITITHRLIRSFAPRIAGVLALGFISFAAAPVSAATDDDVRAFMDGYLKTFDTGHAAEIVSLYDAPLYMLAPNGDIRIYETSKDIRLTVKKWKKSMIGGGFDHTEWGVVNVRSLSDSTAIASTTFDRYSSKGKVYQRGGATYSLRKQDGAWKVFMIHIHTPENVLSFN